MPIQQMLLGAAKKPVVQMSSQSVSSIGGVVTFKFGSNGQFSYSDGGVYTDLAAQWLSRLSTSEAAKYEIRRTHVSGTANVSGMTSGTWYPLSGSPEVFIQNTAPAPSTRGNTSTYLIRTIVGAVNQVSVNHTGTSENP